MEGKKCWGTFEERTVHGRFEGKAKVEVPDGRKYDGDLKGDKPDGRGIMRYPDGREYEGDWKDGKFRGNGE